MKHEHVVPDYWKFLQYSGSYLFMAFCGLLLIRYILWALKINWQFSENKVHSRLIQAVFWLPGHLQKNQEKLEQMARRHNIEVDDDLPMVEEIQEPEPEPTPEEPKKDK